MCIRDRVMTFGFSRASWSGAPLPLSLGIIGANPACNVLAEALVTIPLAVNGGGNGSPHFPPNNDPNILGVPPFSQPARADLFPPRFLYTSPAPPTPHHRGGHLPLLARVTTPPPPPRQKGCAYQRCRA